MVSFSKTFISLESFIRVGKWVDVSSRQTLLKLWNGENKIILIRSKESLDDQKLIKITLVLIEVEDPRKALMI